MTASKNPNDWALGMPRQQQEWAQSVHKTLNGLVDQGTPVSKDATGNFAEFTTGNTSGVLIRVGASGAPNYKYNWTTSHTPITINHGLLDSNGQPRQPIGVHIVNKDKAVDVYMATAPDDKTAQVSPTDATATVTLYFF